MGCNVPVDSDAKISEKDKKTPAFKKQPKRVKTQCEWHGANGEKLAYTASLGHTKIRQNDGTPIGSMFSIAYVVDSAKDEPARPVTFAFNGGPGSASVPINVGGIGPRTVVPNGDRRIGPAPYTIEDNPHTLLQVSDLVFVDALGTGWSEMAENVESEQAWGIDKDADCFARFIEEWLTKNRRWNSPLYIFGESYGTTRNAVLVRVLEERGIAMNGVIMLSSIFDWTAACPGNDWNYIQLYPSCAAIARYHGKTRRWAELDEDAFFQAASDFAENRLAPALLKGDRLEPEVERELAQEMSETLGLSVDYLLEKHLRVELTDFRCEVLREEGRVCGRFDGRYTFDKGNFLQTSHEGMPEDDPSDSGMCTAWSQAWHQIVNGELEYSAPRPYLQSNWEVVGPKWEHRHRSAGVQWDSHTPNVAYDLATTMRHNPTLRVLILGGRYDLATPYLGPIEDMSKMYLSPEIKANLSWCLYDAGHMIYVNPDAHAKMAADLFEFYRA